MAITPGGPRIYSQGSNFSLMALGAVGFGRTNVAPATAATDDVCAAAANAKARNSPSAAALAVMCANLTATPLSGADQVTSCLAAKAAQDRGSPTAAALLQRCAEIRAANIAAGKLIVDVLPADGTTLMQTGNAFIAKSAAYAAQSKTLATPQTQIGYAIGIAVGKLNGSPAYVAYVKSSLAGAIGSQDKPAELVQGFGLGLAATSAVKVAAPASSGIPTPVMIGIGVGLLGALGFAAYKLTR